jgi:hypothetical protein
LETCEAVARRGAVRCGVVWWVEYEVRARRSSGRVDDDREMDAQCMGTTLHHAGTATSGWRRPSNAGSRAALNGKGGIKTIKTPERQLRR